jgi:hypothetical protein
MNLRFLGDTGIKVAELCLSTMTFGGQERATHVSLSRLREVMGLLLILNQRHRTTSSIWNLDMLVEGFSTSIIGPLKHK